MNVATYEATVENGQIQLDETVRLPERARVYVVVPGAEAVSRIQMRSPRLAQPDRTADFVMEVTEDARLAGVGITR